MAINPLVANLLLCPIDGTAGVPSIRFGGTIDGNGGTGIYGSFSGINVSVAGSSVLALSASGISVPGGLTVTGDLHVTGNTYVAATVVILTGAGAPVDGTTGDNIAGPGSLYVDTTAGKLYITTGLITNPTWVVVGSQS